MNIRLLTLLFCLLSYSIVYAQVKKEILKIEGVYYCSPVINDKFTNQNSFVSIINRKVFGNSYPSELSGNSKFEIKILSENKLKIRIYDAFGKEVENRDYKYKLRDNKALLKNRNLRIGGIPYIFGNLEIKKIKFLLDEKSNLNIDYTSHSSGGILLFLFSHFDNSNAIIEYKRIK